MIRLVWRTDVHLSDRAPQSRRDDWAATVFDKLDQVRRVAEKIGAVAVLDGGDFFHIKSPSRNSHDLVRRVADHHARYSCPVYVNIGNHDCVYGDYTMIDQQPLGVLFSSGVFKRLYDEHEAIFTDNTIKVRVVGIPYHGVRYDMDRFWRIKRGDEDYLIVIAHVLASERGGSMFEGEDVVRYRDLADHPADGFIFGHWHKDQGVSEINGKKFINIGSLTRGALTQDEMDRKPAIVVLSFDDQQMSMQIVRLRVASAADVFDVDGRVRAETRTMTMDAFVESLRDTLSAMGGDVLDDRIKSMPNVPDLVRERAIHYLENV